MRKLISILSLAAVVISFQAFRYTDTMNKTNNDPTNKPADEWVKLFDGKTTEGWHTYGKTDVGEVWKVEDGALYLDAANKTGRGDLVTDEEYDNFHLKLDWKIAENGNSGVIFYVHEDPSKFKATYNTGLEMQVLDNDGHPDAKINKHRAGDLYDLIASKTEPVKAVGEWNTAEVISNNGKLDFILNGQKTVSTTMWDEQWKEMVAASKFKTMPGFSTFKSGKIALQDHGDEVWYRNIMIKKL